MFSPILAPRRFIFLGLALPILALRPASANTVSGAIRYANKPYNRTVGFTGVVELLPVRQAEVEVVEGTTALGSGVTDDAGAYSVTIPDGGTKTIFVRVYARRTSANIQAAVKDNNTAAGAVYAAAAAPADVDTGAPQTINLDVIVPAVAGAFNIFDMAVLHFQFLGTLEPLATPPLLSLYWTSGSANGTFFDPVTNSIFLLGGPIDTDEYDDDIIIHELGHYAAANFSKDESPGGAHTITQHVDVRLSWSEGWAHYYSAALRRWADATPAIAPPGTSGSRYPEFVWQVDTSGTGFTAFEIGAPSFPALAIGADNETSVAALLWDIAVDALALGHDEIWTVVNDRLPSRAAVSFEDFFDEWNASGFPDLSAVLSARTVRYAADAREPNNASGAATPLDPVNPTATAAGNTFFPLGDDDWFSFTAVANATYKIETSRLGDGADTTIEAFDPALASIAFNDDRSAGDVSSLAQFKAAAGGVHFIRIAPYRPLVPSDPPEVSVYGSYDLTITVVASGGGAAPAVTLDALPKAGDAPLAVDFTVTASDSDGTVVRYEWDFEGDGVFDFSDSTGGNVRHAYANPGAYSATLRVTDGSGAFSVATILVIVDSADGLAVTASFAFAVSGASTAPARVDFSGTAAGGTARLYEWDFEGDGVYDFLSETTSVASHVYRAGGTYSPVLRVTDDRGRSFRSDENEAKSLGVAPAAVPPGVTLVLSPSPAAGDVPLPVTLTAAATAVAPGAVLLYKWDFDGDGRYDRTVSATAASNAAAFVYAQVGTFLPSVRVTDTSSDLAAVDDPSQRRTVATTASGPAGRVVWPPGGRTVSGSAVTVAAETFPDGASKTVEFQVGQPASQGGTDWQPLGAAQSGTGTLFATAWDTTALEGRTNVSLRVLVNGSAAAAADVTGIAVSASGPALSETADASGALSASVSLPPDEATTVFAGRGAVSLLFPLGSLTGAAPTLLIDAGANPLPVNGSAEGLIRFGSGYDFRLADPPPAVTGRFRMRFYYPDANADGVVDGTSLGERSLAIQWFDAAAGTWRRDLPSDVNTEGNWVETETWHFTTFGVFGSSSIDTGGDHGRCFAGSARTHGAKGSARGIAALLAVAGLMLRRGVRRRECFSR